MKVRGISDLNGDGHVEHDLWDVRGAPFLSPCLLMTTGAAYVDGRHVPYLCQFMKKLKTFRVEGSDFAMKEGEFNAYGPEIGRRDLGSVLR